MSSAAARLSLVDAHAHPSVFSPLSARFTAGMNSRPAANAEPGVDAYARGFAEGHDAAEARFAEERESLRALFASANALAPEPSEELAAMIAMTVERLVTQIVMNATIDAPALTARIEHAMTRITEADAARTLWLHPDDIALLDGFDPGLALCADATLERGALRIDCSAGWLEDSRSNHLDALREALGIEDRS